MLSSRRRLLTVYDARPKVPVIESRSPKALGYKERHSKLVVPGTRFPDRNGGVKITDHFADGGCHIVRGHVGGIWMGPDDERCFRSCLLRDWEERYLLRIFSQRKVLSICHDAHDLDRLAGAVLEIAADGVVGVEEVPGEQLIHNSNSRGLRSVGKAYIASREQWCFSGGKVSG